MVGIDSVFITRARQTNGEQNVATCNLEELSHSYQLKCDHGKADQVMQPYGEGDYCMHLPLMLPFFILK